MLLCSRTSTAHICPDVLLLSRPYAAIVYLGHVVVRKPFARIPVHQVRRTTEAPPRARHGHHHKRPLRLYRQTFHLADRTWRCQVDKVC